MLEDQKRFRDLALFCLSIDTMLRSIDMVMLKVSDVVGANGVVLDGLICAQQKTGNAVEVSVLEYARTAISCWIASKELGPDDFLFPGWKGPHEPLTTGQFRRLVKSWARSIGLNPRRYSCHSLRRTKPAFLHSQQVQLLYLSLLLGHADQQSTQLYVGIDRTKALELARKYDIFNFEPVPCL